MKNDRKETLGPTPSETDRFGTNPAERFEANLADVKIRIAKACERCGRSASAVRLLPITKTVPSQILRAAWNAGIENFGENNIQEALEKYDALNDLPVKWSIVGHLQTNKVKYMTRFASEFHALDSLRLADALNRRLEAADRYLDIFIQVNTSGEDSTYGLRPDELPSFIQELTRYTRLKPRGLMTLAVLSPETERVRTCFKLLRSLQHNALRRDSRLVELSMGMSGDFEIAIEEGATIVRVGQAIFGSRPTPRGYYWPGLLQE
jgi:PLP dependent protein